MNTSILVSTMKNLNYNFDNIVSLASWIHIEMKSIRYYDFKFIRAIKKLDHDVMSSIGCLVKEVKYRDDIYYTIEMMSSIGGNPYEIVKSLLEVKYSFVLMELIIGKYIDNVEAMKLILNSYSNRRSIKDSIFLCSFESLEITKLAIISGANVNRCKGSRLRFACQNNKIEMVSLLLSHGAKVHYYEHLCLRIACELRYVEIVRLLLEHGSDPNARKRESINIATKKGFHDIVKLLTDFGAKPSI